MRAYVHTPFVTCTFHGLSTVILVVLVIVIQSDLVQMSIDGFEYKENIENGDKLS